METFDKICRTCNTERSNLINLNSNAPGNDGYTYLEVLRTICPLLSIQNTDRLPKKICYFCSKQLEIAYRFQLQCQKSNEELIKIVEATIKNETDEDIIQIDKEIIKQDKNSEDSCKVPEINECTELALQEEEFYDNSTATPESPEYLEEEDVNDGFDEGELTEDTVKLEKNLEQNVIATTHKESYTCHYCDKKFYSFNGLRLHKKLSHKISKPLLIETEILNIDCKYCLEVFETNDELNLHIISQHPTSSNLYCLICKKQFPSKNKFDHHLLYHGNNRFECNINDCKRSFTVKYKLTEHMKRFHSIYLSSAETRVLKPC